MSTVKPYFYILFLTFGLANLGFGQSIVGKWKSFENNKPSSIIQIYRAPSGLYEAKMIQILDPNLKGKKCKNCRGERKNQDYRGLVIIRNLQAASDLKSARKGKILDPKKGKEYNCKIWVEGSELKMRAYWGMLYATRTWKKVP